ncbi:MAG: hypothetical protein AAFX05_00185 [Planctomycetota bacterium]
MSACNVRVLVVLLALFTLSLAPQAFASSEDGNLDRLIFLNGRVVDGELLEETATEYVFRVHYGNMPPVETRYRKTEVLELQLDAVAPAEDGDAIRILDNDDDNDDARKERNPNAALIYLVELEGSFGSDISDTPLREMFEDVDRVFGDIVSQPLGGGAMTGVVDPAKRDKHIVVIKLNCEADPRLGFDGIFRAEQLGPIIEEQTQTKGRRIVFWIDRAFDGAAFLPWLSREIYFTTDGAMGFSQDLEDFDSGDDMVDEKLISARFGHAHGFALDGGYVLGPEIINAMARRSYWLAYRMVGGEPELMQRKPTADEQRAGWVVLTDSGDGEYKDEELEAVRNFNDRLILGSDLAYKLGVSKGICDSEADIAHALRVHRNYEFVDHRGQRIFEEWSDSIENALRQISQSQQTPGMLWEEFNRIRVDGSYNDRKRARGRQMNILRQIRSIVKRFEEVWDPSGNFQSNLSLQIEQIKKAQELDKAAQRR